MAQILIAEEKLDKVLKDVEILIEDVASILDQDKIVKQRLKEIKQNPTIAKSEKDLNNYLTKRGVEVE